jgi:methyl acetate hydrolase
MSRRHFGGMAIAMGARAGRLSGAPGLDDTLRAGLKRRGIPTAAAMAATAEKTLYAGAFGKRDASSGVDVTAASIFRIASMTKAITTASALQLVEKGRLKPDDPVAKHLPELGGLQVFQGFDPASGKPVLRPAGGPVLLKHLLTHTSGFVYDNWDGDLLRYQEQTAPGDGARVTPLFFEPGARWEYGTSIDWTGRLVEAVSGLSLEDYFQRNVFVPLGMKDTSFLLPPEKFDRLVNVWQRQGDGSLTENPRALPDPPKSFNGGGGLYSTVADYVRFMQMILRRGRGSDGTEVLRAETVDLMATNQIGALSAGKLKSVRPDRSSDVDFHPGFTDGFTFGFLINATAYEGGRSAGSLAWAGIDNTFFWIDPRRGVCAVLMMQFLPFCDREAMGMLCEFERAVYATLPLRSQG